MGHPEVTTYEAVADIAMDEVAKAVVGTGSATALGDREGMKSHIALANGAPALHGVIDAMRHLIGGAMAETFNAPVHAGVPKEDVIAATGWTPEFLDRFHVDRNMAVATPGPVTYGGRTVEVGPEGVQAPKIQQAKSKDGRDIFGSGGRWVYGDGKPAEAP